MCSGTRRARAAVAHIQRGVVVVPESLCPLPSGFHPVILDSPAAHRAADYCAYGLQTFRCPGLVPWLWRRLCPSPRPRRPSTVLTHLHRPQGRKGRMSRADMFQVRPRPGVA